MEPRVTIQFLTDVIKTLDMLHRKLTIYGIVVEETVVNDITMYTFYKDDIIGNIQMVKSIEMIGEEETPVIRVMYIYVEELQRGKGYSKLMITYGIYMFREKYPEIQLSALDDDSDAASTPSTNLYWKFGYVPKDTYLKTKVNKLYKIPKYLKQTQTEMILDFDSSMMKRFILDLNKYPFQLNKSI